MAQKLVITFDEVTTAKYIELARHKTEARGANFEESKNAQRAEISVWCRDPKSDRSRYCKKTQK